MKVEAVIPGENIRENIRAVEQRINSACMASGRRREDVTLIAVSKTKPLPLLRKAYEAGVRDFGENKVQELLDKMPEMPADVRWHMIGHLQRNKVKYIVGRVYMIHSVDSLRLAEEISREALKKNVTVKILLEVNAAGEESKFGVSVSQAADLAETVSKLPGIRLEGLMTVAPYTENPEENRIYFQKLKQLSVDIAKRNIDNKSIVGIYLSMGMTGDFEIAVEEGASHIRVGTGIFGEREYSSQPQQ